MKIRNKKKKMKAQHYLETYERLYRQAQRLTEEIRQLETIATSGGGAIRYDQTPVMHSPGSGPMGVIDQKVNLEMLLSSVIDEMITLKNSYLEIFNRLVNQDRQIAVLTWLEFEGAVYIASRLKVTTRTVFRRRNAILMIVQELLDSGSD